MSPFLVSCIALAAVAGVLLLISKLPLGRLRRILGMSDTAPYQGEDTTESNIGPNPEPQPGQTPKQEAQHNSLPMLPEHTRSHGDAGSRTDDVHHGEEFESFAHRVYGGAGYNTLHPHTRRAVTWPLLELPFEPDRVADEIVQALVQTHLLSRIREAGGRQAGRPYEENASEKETDDFWEIVRNIDAGS